MGDDEGPSRRGDGRGPHTALFALAGAGFLVLLPALALDGWPRWLAGVVGAWLVLSGAVLHVLTAVEEARRRRRRDGGR